jgi:hypothetical protein
MAEVDKAVLLPAGFTLTQTSRVLLQSGKQLISRDALLLQKLDDELLHTLQRSAFLATRQLPCLVGDIDERSIKLLVRQARLGEEPLRDLGVVITPQPLVGH